MDKKKWKKPKLIVLVRNTSGEAVLNFCKTLQGGGPEEIFQECVQEVSMGCELCMVNAGS